MVGKVVNPNVGAEVGDVAGVAAVDRIKRQPVHPDAGIKLPVEPAVPVMETPLAQSLSNQGFDINPLPRVPAQQAADEAFLAAPQRGARSD